MSWTKHLLAISVATLVTIGTGELSAETIVIRSTGPSARTYPIGKKLPDNSRITLKAGDQLTVLDGRGSRVVSGPAQIQISATASTASLPAFNSLVAKPNMKQARTGAVRGGLAALANSNLWNVDMQKSGTVCLSDWSTVKLWRRDSMSASNYTISRSSDGKSAKVAIGKGATLANWPVAEMAPAKGDNFTIVGPGLAYPVMIKFADANVTDTASLIASLGKNGCDQQLTLIAETYALDSSG